MKRSTGETDVRVVVGGTADADPTIRTGETFLDHMLRTLARYAGLALVVEARGDLRHHTIEDVALTLGAALREAAPETRVRFGHAVVPMDDALVEAALDAGDRPYYRGRLPSSLYQHFLQSLTMAAGWTLHTRVLRGRDRHHVVEAAFKATGFAMRQALAPADDVFSTKGAIRLDGADGADAC